MAMANMVRACADCGDDFTLTADEVDWYVQRFGEHGSIPRRCKGCRNLRRQGRELAEQRETGH